jgi:hypothetical protein
LLQKLNEILFCGKGEEVKGTNVIGKAGELIFSRPLQDVSVGKRKTEIDKAPMKTVRTEKEKRLGVDSLDTLPRMWGEEAENEKSSAQDPG